MKRNFGIPSEVGPAKPGCVFLYFVLAMLCFMAAGAVKSCT
jgi:hypothetical protein